MEMKYLCQYVAPATILHWEKHPKSYSIDGKGLTPHDGLQKEGGTDSRNSWIALSSVECILLASDILNVSSALFCDVSRQQGSPINMAYVFDAFFVVAKVGRQLFHTFCILIITSAMRKEDRVYTYVIK